MLPVHCTNCGLINIPERQTCKRCQMLLSQPLPQSAGSFLSLPAGIRAAVRVHQTHGWVGFVQIVSLVLCATLFAHGMNVLNAPMLTFLACGLLTYGLACILAAANLLALSNERVSGTHHYQPYPAFFLLFMVQGFLLFAPWWLVLWMADYAQTSLQQERYRMIGSGDTDAEAALNMLVLGMLVGYPWLMLLYRALVPEILRTLIPPNPGYTPSNWVVPRPVIIAFAATLAMMFCGVPIVRFLTIVWQTLIAACVPFIWVSLVQELAVAISAALIIPFIVTSSLARYSPIRID